MKKLKIFLVLCNGATGGVDSKIMMRNIYDTLVNMGHKVTLVPFDDMLKEYNPLIHWGQSRREYLSSEI